tara:strand:- start:181 stop:306 length:126 start_codon:yes stop_codon:yes gene_type:complete
MMWRLILVLISRQAENRAEDCRLPQILQAFIDSCDADSDEL